MPSLTPRGANGRFLADFSFDFEGQNLKTSIRDLPSKIDGYIHATMEYQSGVMVKYARVNAPWRDRTGNARSGLSTAVGWVPLDHHTIRLFHRVPYGIFLEVRWAGKYAIIVPTINKYGRDTMRLLTKLFNKLKTQGVIP